MKLKRATPFQFPVQKKTPQELEEIWLRWGEKKKNPPAVKELRVQVATLINWRMRRNLPLKREEKRGGSLTLKAQQGTQIPVKPTQARAGNCNSRAVTTTASGSSWMGIQLCFYPIFCKTRRICFKHFIQLLIEASELSHCRVFVLLSQGEGRARTARPDTALLKPKLPFFPHRESSKGACECSARPAGLTAALCSGKGWGIMRV